MQESLQFNNENKPKSINSQLSNVDLDDSVAAPSLDPPEVADSPDLPEGGEWF